VVPYAAVFKGNNTAFKCSPITWACKRDGAFFFKIKSEPGCRFLSNLYFVKGHWVALSAIAVCKDDTSIRAASFRCWFMISAVISPSLNS